MSVKAPLYSTSLALAVAFNHSNQKATDLKATIGISLTGNPENRLWIMQGSWQSLTLNFRLFLNLMVSHSFEVTQSWMTGRLLSSAEDQDHMSCLLPVSLLNGLCRNCLTIEELNRFFSVVHSSFDEYVFSVMDGEELCVQYGGPVEMSAEHIWTILVYSEVFGCGTVFHSCKAQLERLIFADQEGCTFLSRCFKDLSEEATKRLRRNLLRYFQKYQTSALEISFNREPANKLSSPHSPNPNPSRDENNDIFETPLRDNVKAAEPLFDSTYTNIKQFSLESPIILAKKKQENLTKDLLSSAKNLGCIPRSVKNAETQTVELDICLSYRKSEQNGFPRTIFDDQDSRSQVWNMDKNSSSPRITNSLASLPSYTESGTASYLGLRKAKNESRSDLSSDIARLSFESKGLDEVVKEARSRAQQRAREYIAKQRALNNSANGKLRSKSPSASPVDNFGTSSINRLDSELKSKDTDPSPITLAKTKVSKMSREKSPTPSACKENEDQAEEARKRAAIRIKEAKVKLAAKKEKEDKQKEEQRQKKWVERDIKISAFLERQLTNSFDLHDTPQASSKAPNEKSPWLVENDVSRVTIDKSPEPQTPLKISEPPSDAIEHAEEVESMIDEALTTRSHLLARSKILPLARDLFSSPESPPNPYALSTALLPQTNSTASLDLVSVTVVRAWDLPDALGTTNPYIVIDWGALGRSSTHSITSTTNPSFGSYLRFKSPFKQCARGAQDLVVAGLPLKLSDVPLKVFAFSRNKSVSDDLLGEATVKKSELLIAFKRHLQGISANDTGSSYHAQLCLQLRSEDSEVAGFVEMIVSIEP